jgi:hypothetical protein
MAGLGLDIAEGEPGAVAPADANLGPFLALGGTAGTDILRAKGNGGTKGCYTYIVEAAYDGGTDWGKVELSVDPQVDNMADPPMHLWQDPECAGDSWTEVESPDSSADEP